MVRDELADGKRIGQLLSSEIHGHERGTLGRLAVVEADADVEPSDEGAFAYGIDVDGPDGDRIASAYVHPDRLRLEFGTGLETARSAAEGAGLRARSTAADPPRTIVPVGNGAEVKAALAVLRAVLEERFEPTD
jgi:hypothetical protein